MGANIKIETLADIVRHKGNLRVECRCEHVGVVDAAKMGRWYACHCWNARIHALGLHLRCRRCRGRPARWLITGERPNAPDRFPRDERGWAELVRRLRG